MERSNHNTRIYSGSATRTPSLFLLHSPSHLLESFLHYVNKLPYGWENLTHQFTHHNNVTTYSHLLHTYFTPIHYLTTPLLHTYFLHTNLLHFKLLHTYLLHFNLLHNKSISTFYTPSISSKLLITNTTQLHKYINTMYNYSSMLLELSCRRSVLLLHFGWGWMRRDWITWNKD